MTADKPFDPQAFKESVDAAAGPLKRMAAVTACCCLCSVYEPHLCEGWRAEGLEREVPGGPLFGKQLAPVKVPVCRSCNGAKVREV